MSDNATQFMDAIERRREDRDMEMSLLKSQVDEQAITIKRLLSSYDGLITAHALLMLESLESEEISNRLSGAYQFILTEDAGVDVRNELVQIYKENKRIEALNNGN